MTTRFAVDGGGEATLSDERMKRNASPQRSRRATVSPCIYRRRGVATLPAVPPLNLPQASPDDWQLKVDACATRSAGRRSPTTGDGGRGYPLLRSRSLKSTDELLQLPAIAPDPSLSSAPSSEDDSMSCSSYSPRPESSSDSPPSPHSVGQASPRAVQHSPRGSRLPFDLGFSPRKRATTAAPRLLRASPSGEPFSALKPDRRPSLFSEVLQHFAGSDVDSDGGGAAAQRPFTYPAAVTLPQLFELFHELYVAQRISELDLQLKIFFAASHLLASVQELLLFFVGQLKDEAHSSFYLFVLLFWLSCDDRNAATLAAQLRLEMTQQGIKPDVMIQLELAGLQSTDARAAATTLPELAIEDRNAVIRCFWSLAPRHAAQYMAGAHHAFIARIQPSDYLAHTATRNNRVCAEACDHFNHMVGWITSSILKCPTPKRRAKKIVQWLKIAEAAHEAGFLSVLLALTNALDHFTVSRLKKTWECVPPSHRDALLQLLEFCSPHGNFKRLRESARHSGHPLPLAVFLKDVLFVCEVLPASRAERFAYDQFHMLGAMLVRQTKKCRASMFSRSLIDASSSQLSDFLLNPLPRYTEEKMFARSRALEAPLHASASASAIDSDTSVVVENALVGMLRARSESRDPPTPNSLAMSAPTITTATTSEHRSPSPQRQAALSSSSEVRSENQLYLLLRQQQRAQQTLLPSTSAVADESPRKSFSRLSRLLKTSDRK